MSAIAATITAPPKIPVRMASPVSMASSVAEEGEPFELAEEAKSASQEAETWAPIGANAPAAEVTLPREVLAQAGRLRAKQVKMLKDLVKFFMVVSSVSIALDSFHTGIMPGKTEAGYFY